MLLGVEHLVGQLFLGQQLSDDLGILDRGGAHQHRLAALVALADVVNGSLVFFGCGFVHAVKLVLATAGAVGRDDHRLQTINFLELVGLGVRRAGHARELVVQAKVVLEGDGGQRLVFGLDGNALFGLDGLVQTVAPAPPGHQAAGKFVHDDDLAVLHHIVLVAVVEVVGAQSRVHMVHERDIGRVVQRGARRNQVELGEQALGAFMALLGQKDLLRFFVQREIARGDHAFAGTQIELALLALERGDDAVDGHVHLGVVFGLPADDQRRARLVDQDGVHLVHDGKVEPALHPVARLVDHVVAQVVKAVLVIGAVGDVGLVGGLLFGARGLGGVDAHRQSQKSVELAHPARVAPGQVVVDGDHVHALAGQGIEVHGQGGGQGFALAGAHFGNFALVQGHAAHELHVKVAHFHDALGAFAHHRKSLGQDGVQGFASGYAGFELGGFATQGLVRQALQRRLQRIDAGHGGTVLLEQAVVAASKELGQKGKWHRYGAGARPPSVTKQRLGSRS